MSNETIAAKAAELFGIRREIEELSAVKAAPPRKGGTVHSTTEGRPPSKEEHTMTFQNERAEIIAIAEMLTDGEDIYFLLGAARGLLKLEAKKEKAQ